jgi:putative endonuclease
MKYYVYILFSESADSFYKGQTTNLEDRMNRHNSGMEKATSRYAPWKLIWSTVVSSRSEATRLERKIKNLTRKRLLDFISKYGD